MLATVSPAYINVEETLTTLRYADRAKQIQIKATKNEEQSQIDALNDEIIQLRAKLQEAVRCLLFAATYCVRRDSAMCAHTCSKHL